MDVNAFSILKEFIPPDYEYLVSKFYVIEGGFHATLRLKLSEPSAVREWRKAFQDKTFTTYCRKTGVKIGRVVILKEKLYCHRGRCNILSPSRQIHQYKHKKTKQTGCRATMVLTLRSSTLKRYADKLMPQYPFMVEINWTHNHAIKEASDLVFRRLGEETKEKMTTLFHQGFTPAATIPVFQQIVMENKNNLKDRKYMPRYIDAKRFFVSAFEERYKKFTGVLSMTEVSEAIKSRTVNSDSDVHSEVTEDGNLIVAVVTPFMKKAHKQYAQSGELVFMDSCGGMDKNNLRVYLLVTCSSLGGLPLGCFLTTSEDGAVVEKALRLLLDMLPPRAFYGRAGDGPLTFMTSNSSAEKEALGAVFPKAKQYLSVFHILQATWRHLWGEETIMPKEHRCHILNLMKGILCCTSVGSLEAKWKSASEDIVLTQYESVKNHFHAYWSIKHRWALCFYQESLVKRGSDPNDLLEKVFVNLRDNILRRQMSDNVVQLVDSIIHLSQYFSATIMEKIRRPGCVGANPSIQKPMVYNKLSVKPRNVTPIEEDIYSVREQKDHYTVHSLLGLCSCRVGMTGVVCKHQFAVRNAMGFHFLEHLPVPDKTEGIAAHSRDNRPDDSFDFLRSDRDPFSTGADIAATTTMPIISEVFSLKDVSDDDGNDADVGDDDNVGNGGGVKGDDDDNNDVDTQSEPVPPVQDEDGKDNKDRMTMTKCLKEFDVLSRKIRQAAMAHPKEFFHPLKSFVDRCNAALHQGLHEFCSVLSPVVDHCSKNSNRVSGKGTNNVTQGYLVSVPTSGIARRCKETHGNPAKSKTRASDGHLGCFPTPGIVIVRHCKGPNNVRSKGTKILDGYIGSVCTPVVGSQSRETIDVPGDSTKTVSGGHLGSVSAPGTVTVSKREEPNNVHGKGMSTGILLDGYDSSMSTSGNGDQSKETDDVPENDAKRVNHDGHLGSFPKPGIVIVRQKRKKPNDVLVKGARGLRNGNISSVLPPSVGGQHREPNDVSGNSASTEQGAPNNVRAKSTRSSFFDEYDFGSFSTPVASGHCREPNLPGNRGIHQGETNDVGGKGVKRGLDGQCVTELEKVKKRA